MLSYDERPAIYGTTPSRSAMQHLTNVNAPLPRHRRHIWIITGPAGCGKSTIADYLSRCLQVPYVEGDEYHPTQNVKKMAEGIPLTDADRWDWLVLLRQKAVEKLAAGYDGVVLTCSALKRKYRDVIRIAAYNDHDVIVRFVYLRANEKVLLERVRARKGHYMKDSMVKSQINSLEEPDESEIDVLSVDVSGSLSSVQGAALAKVEESLGED
ncbi:MAG: hypothetical protein M1813_004427 [Trichoglossum hirsutum]|nr:MAG: hypothetical protein M1813_004427 [Trichoglossum hirsutum]